MLSQDSARDDTQTTYSSIRSEMTGALHKSRLRKILSAVLFGCLALFLILFFTLPAFQAKGASVTGLTNFTEEDLAVLSKSDGYQLNLTFDTSKASATALEESQGFLLECEYSTNGIVSSCEVTENYPVATYQSTAYLADGSTEEEALDKISSLPLSGTRKENLKSALEEESQSSLPTVHLPSSLPDNYDLSEAFTPLAGLPYESLLAIDHIAYVNDSSDSRWSNVAEVLIQDDTSGNYYRLTNLLSENFALYFSPSVFPDKMLSTLSDSVTRRNLTASDYSFSDDPETVYSVYSFKVLINKDGTKVDILSLDETSDENLSSSGEE